MRSDSASGCTTTRFPGDRYCYDRAALVPSRGTIMIYFRPHDGRSLRYNVNVRHLKVLVVPLFPLWIIGAFCVKDSKWLLNFVVVFYRICASFRRSLSSGGPTWSTPFGISNDHFQLLVYQSSSSQPEVSRSKS